MVVEPMPIPGVGSFAMFQDPDGVMVGIVEERRERRAVGAAIAQVLTDADDADDRADRPRMRPRSRRGAGRSHRLARRGRGDARPAHDPPVVSARTSP